MQPKRKHLIFLSPARLAAGALLILLGCQPNGTDGDTDAGPEAPPVSGEDYFFGVSGQTKTADPIRYDSITFIRTRRSTVVDSVLKCETGSCRWEPIHQVDSLLDYGLGKIQPRVFRTRVDFGYFSRTNRPAAVSVAFDTALAGAPPGKVEVLSVAGDTLATPGESLSVLVTYRVHGDYWGMQLRGDVAGTGKKLGQVPLIGSSLNAPVAWDLRSLNRELQGEWDLVATSAFLYSEAKRTVWQEGPSEPRTLVVTDSTAVVKHGDSVLAETALEYVGMLHLSPCLSLFNPVCDGSSNLNALDSHFYRSENVLVLKSYSGDLRTGHFSILIRKGTVVKMNEARINQP